MSIESTLVADRHRIAFEAFGVPVSVEVASAELLARVRSILPPESRPCESVPEEHEFKLSTRDGVNYRVEHPGQSLPGSSDLDVALEVLDSELRAFIAMGAPGHVFVHAGVVALGERAIVMPGPTFSGKTTLVAQFVHAGAAYYSDDLAPLDREGFVHPYPKPLSIRSGSFSQTDHDVVSLGGSAGIGGLPIGLVVFTQYRPGAFWDPHHRSRGDGVLAMLANTVPARERPEDSLTALTRAVHGAVVLEGERGEALEVVERILHNPGPYLDGHGLGETSHPRGA
jgi:hypothetical protein